MKNLLETTTGYSWSWQVAAMDENNPSLSRIIQVLDEVNVLNEADWPVIIAFIKPRIMALDNFWEMVKDGFE